MPVPAPFADRPAPHTVIKHTPSYSLPCGLGFRSGLAAADNASAIKGPHAQACIPPMFEAPHFSDDYPFLSKPAKDDGGGHLQWPPRPAVVLAALSRNDPRRHITPDASIAYGLSHSHHGTTPPFGFGDLSPAFDTSPLEPLTPFADFVDRAVATIPIHDASAQPMFYSPPQVHPTLPDPHYTSDTVIPSATCGYKKLSEPLANWVANYIWEVCTTGFSLPAPFAHTGAHALQFSPTPPSVLASSIHSVLLSTLLQPSGVLLALWYVARLPVYLAAAPLPVDAVKEHAFRSALLDGGFQSETGEATVPFRLVMLGFMLANKWLDDHTFSNKTWHSISNIPVQTLNRLESAALDIFNYDLSIPVHQWSQWLGHLMSYHQAQTASGHPQPISRPSANPHILIKKAIEEIMESSIARFSAPNLPVPVFTGLDERLRERMMEHEKEFDISEIDLDEDGPLREEYMPKRKSSHRLSQGRITTSVSHQNWDLPKASAFKPLPPPAKWSPAGDEPILRDKNRPTAHYVAVQPSVAAASLHPARQEPVQNQNWNPVHGYFAPPPVVSKPQMAYNYELAPQVRPSRPTFTPFGHLASSISVPHIRTQSLTYDHENLLLRNSSNHLRSFSQAEFLGAVLGDLGFSRDVDGRCQWMVDPAARYPYHGPAYVSIPALGL